MATAEHAVPWPTDYQYSAFHDSYLGVQSPPTGQIPPEAVQMDADSLSDSFELILTEMGDSDWT